jgi:hypothetical protein
MDPAASGSCASRVDRCRTFLDVLNLSVHIDDERCAIRHSRGQKNSVSLRGAPGLKIAQEWKAELEFFRPMPECRNIVRADAEHLCVRAFKFCDTSLVSSYFLRSTTGESRREECQDNGFFPAKFRQRHRLPGSLRKSEIRRHITDL